MKDRGNRRRKKQEDTSSTATSSSSSSSEDDVRITSKRHKHSRKRHREDRSRSDGISRRDEEKRRRRRNKKREKNRSKDENRKSRREGKRKASESESEDGSASETDNDSSSTFRPEGILQHILKEFPSVMGDLVKLLQMIDDGQGVDISGLSEILLVENLKKLFYSLHLKEKDNKFLLRRKARPTLEVVLPIIQSWTQSEKNLSDKSLSPKDTHRVTSGVDAEQKLGNNTAMPCQEEDVGPRKRVIGPAMPSAELLAAAAKLTEAEAELREVELDEDTGLFIGPAPPAVVNEAESANEAERFEEVTRIMSVEVDNPYDVVGVNRNMLDNNIKKRYWKLSLMVHPDKCSHPEANQAFIKLNKAFKDLQDPNKRKALDDKIKLKEEQEEFKAELKTMREAAQWRRLQGISMEGDDALLADMDVKVEPRREEWMTTLPPERKPGVTMQTTKFSKNAKEGRGDTSIWTDTPSERAQKAKMNYLEAYNEAAALASNELEKKMNPDAELVDKYNKAKRSKSLVEKHQEAVSGRTSSKKKSKSKQQQQEATKGEWEGQHPWKPWDRDKDLTAGRQSVKLDPENMSQGLTSRFSSGSFQRNFL